MSQTKAKSPAKPSTSNGLSRSDWDTLRARYAKSDTPDSWKVRTLREALLLREGFVASSIALVISAALFALSIVGCSRFTGWGDTGMTGYGALVLSLMACFGSFFIATPVLWLLSQSEGVRAWNEPL